MVENQTNNDTEKLRAFEKKMHDEGTAGFADGPSPWETWSDESGLLGNNRVWDGKSKRIYPKQTEHTLGDRILFGLTMLSLATMVVGIAGVYFSDQQTRQEVATGIEPLPINRTPPAADKAVASLETLPAPAAGTPSAANTASGTDRNDPALPASATLSGPDTVVLEIEAPPATTAIAQPAGDAGIDTTSLSTTPQHLAASNVDTTSAAASATDTEPASPPATAITAPVAVKSTAATDYEAAMTAAETDPVTAATATGQPPLSVPAAETASVTEDSLAAVAAGPATAIQTDIATAETGLVPVTTITAPETRQESAADSSTLPETVRETEADPDAPVAVAAQAEPLADTGVADTVASLEALPATTAGTTDTAEEAPADSTAISSSTTDTVVVAVTEPGTRTATTAPAAAVEPAAATVKTGDWVVNLASYTRESTASRMLTRFRDKGVDVELVTVMINDKPMHRLRVTGFTSSREAKARIGPLEQQLGLDGVWISRK
jgi:cell division septation protein DedD